MNQESNDTMKQGVTFAGARNFSGVTYEDDDTEINIASLLRYIFLHWRGLLLCALALGVILGAVKFVPEYRKVADANVVDDAADESDLAVKSYESKKTALETNVANITKQLDEANEYMNDSILMNIDKNQVYRVYLSYYVTANGNAVADNTKTAGEIDTVSSAGMLIIGDANDAVNRMTGSVLAAYAKALQENALLKIVRENITDKVPNKYLRELMHITVDYTNGMIDVSVVGNSKELVEAYAEAVRKQISSKEAYVASMIGEHTISNLADTEYITTDSYYQQNTDTSNIYETNVATVQQNYTGTVTDLQNRLNDAYNQISTLEVPATTVFTKRDALKKGIKYGLIGLFVGFFAYAVILAIYFVASGKIMDPDELGDHYGLRILGHYYKPVKSGAGHALDRFIAGTDHHSRDEEDITSVINVSAANTAITLTNGGNILVAGGNDKVREEFSRAANGRFNVNATENIANTADGALKLRESDGVVIFVEKEKTYRKDLEAELKQLQATGKPLYGIIII